MSTIEHDNDAGLTGFMAGWDKRLQENEQLPVGVAVLVLTTSARSPSPAHIWPRFWAGP